MSKNKGKHRCRSCGCRIKKTPWDTPSENKSYACVKCGLAIFKTKTGEWINNPF